MWIFGNDTQDPNAPVDDTAAVEGQESQAADITAEQEKLAAEREAFEAEKAALADEKAEYETQKEADEAAFLEKQAQIDEYQEKVKSNNKELEHIDFDRTNIKFKGKKRLGKPTAKAPTDVKVRVGEKVEVVSLEEFRK